MKRTSLPVPGGMPLPKVDVDPKVDLAIEKRCKEQAKRESKENIKRLSEKYGVPAPGR